MGAKLQKAFQLAKDSAGLQGQMRLAMKAGMTTEKAAGIPDSPENLKKMQAVLKEVIGKDITL